MADPITTQSIKDVAQEPKSVSGDQGSVSNQSLRDLIVADQYLRQVEANKPKNRKSLIRGMFTKLSSPGSRR